MTTAAEPTAVLRPGALLARADALLPAFEEALAGMPRETVRKGICPSEMFFLYAAVRPLTPTLFLESGRARAESTLALARCFPASRISSVEFMRDPVDAPIAAEKLRPHGNVECLFGDSRTLLPPRLEPGCVVLIDGPKEFRALKLALRLLRTGQPAAVFLHDFGQGRPEREFLERHWPGAFFSDAPEFLTRYSPRLDAGQMPDADLARPRPSAFACLPGGAGALPDPVPWLLARLALAQVTSRVWEKVLGRSRPGD